MQVLSIRLTDYVGGHEVHFVAVSEQVRQKELHGAHKVFVPSS